LTCLALAITPDSSVCFCCCSDGKIYAWDLRSSLLRKFQGHTNSVNCIDISSDGNKLWTGSNDETVRSWDLREGRELQQYDFNSAILSVGYSHQKNFLAVGMESGNLDVLDFSNENIHNVNSHKISVMALKFSQDGYWFASAADNLLNVLTTSDMATVVQIEEPSLVQACDISLDGKFIVTGSADMTANVYEVQY
jgi:WD40 repeat protein